VDEVAALRRGDLAAVARAEAVTVEEAIDRFLAQHEVDPATHVKLTRELNQRSAVWAAARPRVATRRTRGLAPDARAGWRHGVFRALRQVLEQATRWRWIDENPARYVKNPKPKAPTIEPFESWAVIEAIANELDPRFAAIPLFPVGTGLRPEEWIALERRDVDRGAGVVTVERVYSQGRRKPCGKSSRQRRRVPLRQRVLERSKPLPRA
jgi:integrase